MKGTAQSGDLEVGEEVLLRFGTHAVRATVVEDRGHLGVGGRQIVTIEFGGSGEDDPVRRFEVPAAELERVAQPAA